MQKSVLLRLGEDERGLGRQVELAGHAAAAADGLVLRFILGGLGGLVVAELDRRGATLGVALLARQAPLA